MWTGALALGGLAEALGGEEAVLRRAKSPACTYKRIDGVWWDNERQGI